MTRQEVLEMVARAAINARKSGYWEATGGSTISVTQEVRDLNQALNILEQGLCPECKGSGFDPKDICDHNEVPDPCPVCHGAKYLDSQKPQPPIPVTKNGWLDYIRITKSALSDGQHLWAKPGDEIFCMLCQVTLHASTDQSCPGLNAAEQKRTYMIGALAMAHYYHGEYAADQFKGDHAGRAMRPEHLEWAKANIGLVELPEPIDQEKE